MKNGFTFIEVMVVIVIVGVLATIGMPKIFGLVAKAKASEIPVAAGTYIKAQDAYLLSKSTVGNWHVIGYEAPGNGRSSNFCYIQGDLTEDRTAPNDLDEDVIGWAASNLDNLNMCGRGSWWSVVISENGENAVKYTSNVNHQDCQALTSGWQVGITMNGNCESARNLASEEHKRAEAKEEEPITPPQVDEPETPPQTEQPETPATDNEDKDKDKNKKDKCGKKITDPRCCNGKNKTDCVCGQGQLEKYGIPCE